ncbi:alpha/beta fold hydrolase [Halorubrum sp. CBA1125]|uniref:alpha/beta fold hydrolase n=1 Tax=Halorubrum sp. CBA1125 TaxID=2668072 RepID=UPI001E3031C3|nr:alpha/beta hydrolase [Halorubrum sp. CBA1125]
MSPSAPPPRRPPASGSSPQTVRDTGARRPRRAGGGWAAWRDDLTALLDAEDIDRAPIVGFSGGGPFALASAPGDRTTRVGVIGSVVPPARNPLTLLSRVPFALGALFRVARLVARVRGPESVVAQYTDERVSDAVAGAVAADFHEALRQGPTAAVRETRLFAEESVGAFPSSTPVRAWHGTRDGNAPIGPVRSLLDGDRDTVVTVERDHLGTLLACRRDAFTWATDGASR